jgi:alpha-L-fucosidase
LADYHTARQLLLMLIDIVSRGGNLLLDIGPRADGIIPVVMEERLAQIGDWLHPNGEAIYGTSACKRSTQWSSGEVPHLEQKEFRAEYDITKMVDEPPKGYAHIEAFFTQKGGNVYAILPHWASGEVILHDFGGGDGASATLVGNELGLKLQVRGRDLAIVIPESARDRREAYVIRLKGVEMM